MTVLPAASETPNPELMQTAKTLFPKQSDVALLHALKRDHPGVDDALVVNWIRDEADDVYWLLRDKETMLIVEVPRRYLEGQDLTVQSVDVMTFQRRALSPQLHKRLNDAIQIMGSTNHATSALV